MPEDTIVLNPARSLWHRRSLITMLLLSAAYLLLSALLIGFRPEQLFLLAIINAMYFASRATRKLITGFSIFVVYWIVFDYMKAFPNYHYQPVHIASLYGLEKSLFGIGPTAITPNEYWLAHHNSVLDVMTGIFYLTWVPVPLGFAAWLFYKNRREFLYFSMTFLLVNLLGFAIYYIYPAAPPWYVQQHGFDFVAATKGNTAGLARFDAFFNVSVFKSLYEKSSNVFAAMPSLHSSYPAIVLYYGLRNKLGAVNILFAVLMGGIWFSAVYTSHHYVLDVLAGVCCAATGIILFNRLSRTKVFEQGLLRRMLRAVS
jgi:hypothetical protein